MTDTTPKGPTVKGPTVKGWCPGAHTPMQSGDGLIIRVRPRLGQLSPRQAVGLCEIANTFGNRIIDLTNRANLQLRGIKSNDHQAVLDALLALDLLDATPQLEAKRNIVCAPLRANDGLTERLATQLTLRLNELPPLPGKFGFAIDADGAPQLHDAPADIRIENGADGLIVRADGARLGQAVTPDTAINALLDIARWFADTRQDDVRRMKAHLVAVPLPHCFACETTQACAAELGPGQTPQGWMFGTPFGSLPVDDLLPLLHANPTATLTLTPFRMFMLSGQFTDPQTTLITRPNDPTLSVDACPGAPACTATIQRTRAIAHSIIPHLAGRSLHISGCTKGCARPRRADVVLVGQTDGFDLVLNGFSWDVPVLRGISPDSVADAVIKELGRH